MEAEHAEGASELVHSGESCLVPPGRSPQGKGDPHSLCTLSPDAAYLALAAGDGRVRIFSIGAQAITSPSPVIRPPASARSSSGKRLSLSSARRQRFPCSALFRRTLPPRQPPHRPVLAAARMSSLHPTVPRTSSSSKALSAFAGA